MSWFDSSSFTNLAYNALSQAQKRIDKVLDIDEEAAQKEKETGLKASSGSKVSSSSYTSQLSGKSFQGVPSACQKTPWSAPARRTRTSSESTTLEDDSFWSSFLGAEESPKGRSSKLHEKKISTEEPIPQSSSKISQSSSDTNIRQKHKLGRTQSDGDNSTKYSLRKESSRTRLKSGNKNESSVAVKSDMGLVKHEKSDDTNNLVKTDYSSKDEVVSIQGSNNKASDDKEESSPINMQVKERDSHETQQKISKDIEQKKVQCLDSKETLEIDITRGKALDGQSKLIDKMEAESGERSLSNVKGNNIVQFNEDHYIEETKAEHTNLETSEVIHAPSEKSVKSEIIEAMEEQVSEQNLTEDFIEVNDIPMEISTSHNIVQSDERNELMGHDTSTMEHNTDLGTCERGSIPQQSEVAQTIEYDATERHEHTFKYVPLEDSEENSDNKSGILSALASFVQPLASSTPSASPIVKWIQDTTGNVQHGPADGTQGREIGYFLKDEKENMEQVDGEAFTTVLTPLKADTTSKDTRSKDDSNVDCEDVSTKDDSSENKSSEAGIICQEQVVACQEKAEQDIDISTELTGDVNDEQGESDDVLMLKQNLRDLQHVLQARESKQVELSKLNIDLTETNSILRSQLVQLEASHQTDEEEVEEIKQEFVKRIALTEKKLHQASKERDQFKQQLEETEKYLTSANDQQMLEHSSLLKEKDEQITQLLGEGEKLSKQQLQSNNIIKKLRAKEKENDVLIKKQTKRLEETEAELERLTGILKAKDENEKKMEDGINQLNAYVTKQEDQTSKQKSELEDLTEKVRGLQSALDNAYKEMAEMHRKNAVSESAIQETKWSVQMSAKEDLRIALERARHEAAQDQEALGIQVTDLRTSLNRSEQQAARREDHLRQEIREFQQRLQEAEGRNQELVGNVTSATRPLLRQIENLQSTFSSQSVAWEKVEKSLTDRLTDAMNQLAVAQEKERSATEHALDVSSQMSSLQCQVTTLKQDKSRLEAQLEMEKTRSESLQENLTRESGKVDALRKSHKKLMDDAQVEQTLLEQQLAVERSKVEAAQKKTIHLQEEKERRSSKNESIFSSAPQSPTILPSASQDEILQNSLNHSLTRHVSSNHSDIIRTMNGGTALTERLQAQLQQKEVEIEVLQEEIGGLERTRDSLTEELTLLNINIESLTTESEKYTELQETFKELQQRHNAVLQMYGEKAEEAEELRMDLEDVKSMYRAQIDQLLGTMR